MYLCIMEVTNIEQKVYHSNKTGKDYFSYVITLACPVNVNGREGVTFRNVTLKGDEAIQLLIRQRLISSYQDLIGRDIILARKCPHYVDDFEAKFRSLQADMIVSVR